MRNFLFITASIASLSILSACDREKSAILDAVSERVSKPICQAAPSNGTVLNYADWGGIVKAWADEEYIQSVPFDSDFVLQIDASSQAPYKFTEKGQKLIESDAPVKEICFAERDVDDITSISEPYENNGNTYIDVEASYEDRVTADWAEDIQAIKDRYNQNGSVKYRFRKNDGAWVIDSQLN